MSEPNVRVGDVPVVHGVTPGGWTICGLIYTTDPNAFFFVKAVPTDDPVDCMACLVQETRGPAETFRFSGTIWLPVTVREIWLEVELEPEPENE